MIGLDGERLASAAGAEVLVRGGEGSPTRAVIDSRSIESGDLFVGLPGESADGGQFALDALRGGAWGVLAGAQWAREIAHQRGDGGLAADGWVLGAEDPLSALQRLARFWRHELGAQVVGITGSTGKTSVKDICRAILPEPVHASPQNFNTEIGLPLAILAAPPETRSLVLEMGMRGVGQIAKLTEIAEPDVGVITNIGPVHIELLGSVEAIAAVKAEILAGLADGGTGVVPADEPLLVPHLEGGATLLRFGGGGDVEAVEAHAGEGRFQALVRAPGGEQRFDFPFDEAYNLDNALAAIAAGIAIGTSLEEMSERAPGIVFSRLRGELVRLPGDSTLINDCYNANPISMRAALDHLASIGDGRRVAVLGDMRELGPDESDFHREVGEHARERGVQLLIGVGALAEAYAPDVLVADADAAADALQDALAPGDTVLVKGSRAVGLELVAERLEGGTP